MRLDENMINDIRNSADIVDVISHYINVEKKGKSYVCVCPFHDDHTPSMSISQEKQIFKCFVCNEGGNVFSFVQKYANLSFQESVVEVSKIIGKPLDVDLSSSIKTVDPHKAALYKVLNESIRYFVYSLNTQNALEKKNYLKNRGFSDKIIEQFEIGYNPSGDELYRFLKAKGYKDEDIISSGLGNISASGIHDVFNNRITFPIYDSLGNPVGFTARTLDTENQSKYVNTAETEIYVKGDLVYNYHKAKPYAKKLGRVIVCEGVTDVIAMAKAGVLNAVATLGTACTKVQIKLLKQCGEIVYCYDGDEAGQMATYKAGKLARQAGAEVKVVQNKLGLDPDEIVTQKGAEALSNMVSKPITWVEFCFDFLQTKFDMSNYSDTKEYAKRVMVEINGLTDPFDKDNFTRRLADITKLNLQTLQKEIKEPVTQVDRPRSTGKSLIIKNSAENCIINEMLLSKEASEIFKNKLGFLPDPMNQLLANEIIEAYRNSDYIDVAKLYDKIEDSKVKEVLIAISSSELFDTEYKEDVLNGAIDKIRANMVKAKIEKLKQQAQTCTNEQSKVIIMQELAEAYREYRRYFNEDQIKES